MRKLELPDNHTNVIASVSGGKDSTAMALALKRSGIPFVPIFADTGWEHASTYDHISEIEEHIGPIVRVENVPDLDDERLQLAEEVEAAMGRDRPSSFVRWCLKDRIFPSRLMRWCTRQLKMRPISEWLKANTDGPVLNTIGIRAEESARRAKMPAIEQAPWNRNVTVWRPLLDWSMDDVVAEHHAAGVRPNPLYLLGSERVGCWPCIMAKKSQVALLAKDQQRLEAIRLLERFVTHLRSEIDEKPAGLFLSPFKNRPRGWQIDEILRWATGHHQQQFPWPDDSSCMRWGLCERASDG